MSRPGTKSNQGPRLTGIAAWIASAAERKARMEQLWRIRIDDASPSPPVPIQPTDGSQDIEAERINGKMITANDCADNDGNDLNNQVIAAQIVVGTAENITPPETLLQQLTAACICNCATCSRDHDRITPPDFLSEETPMPGAKEHDLQASDGHAIWAGEITADDVSSCSGSSDSHPVSRKARKFLSMQAVKATQNSISMSSKRSYSTMDVRSYTTMESNLWLATPKKSCQYLDLVSKHPSDCSGNYSTDDSGVLTDGFIDDEDKDNWHPTAQEDAMAKCLPITYRNLQLHKRTALPDLMDRDAHPGAAPDEPDALNEKQSGSGEC